MQIVGHKLVRLLRNSLYLYDFIREDIWKMKKIERGVMVMKNGKAWGIKYEDGRETMYGWMNPVDAPIYDPQFCKNPLDVTYKNSPHITELSTAQLVAVERETIVKIVNDSL